MACKGAGDVLLTLPPLVEGTVRGELELRLGPLVWERPQGSAHALAGCRVRVLWWGDSSGGVLLPVGAADAASLTPPGASPPPGLPPPVAGGASPPSAAMDATARCASAGASTGRQGSAPSGRSPPRPADDACAADAAPQAVARFGVRSSMRHLSAYLVDAGVLTLTLEDRFGGMLGEAAVPLAALAAAAKPGSGNGAPVPAAARFVARGSAAEAPDLHGRLVARAAMQMRVAYPAAGFAETPCSAGLSRVGGAVEPQPDTAGPEEPRRVDAVPAPVPWTDAWCTRSALGPCPSREPVAESAQGHAVAEPQGGLGAPSAGPPGVWWSGELRGWQAQAAAPGQAHAWQQGACFGAVPIAYLAAWQRQAQAQGVPVVPPAWSRQAAPAQPILVPPWPAYAPQAWLASPGPPLAAAQHTPAAGPAPGPSGLRQGHAIAPENTGVGAAAGSAAQGMSTQGLRAASPCARASSGGSGKSGKGPTRRGRAGSVGNGRAAGAFWTGAPGVGGVRSGSDAGRSAAAAAAAGDAGSSDSSADGRAAAGAVGSRGAVPGDVPLEGGAPGRRKRARKARPLINIVLWRSLCAC